MAATARVEEGWEVGERVATATEGRGWEGAGCGQGDSGM